MKKYPHGVMPDGWPPFTRAPYCPKPKPIVGPYNRSRPCYDESKSTQTSFYGWRIPSYVAPQIMNCPNPSEGYLDPEMPEHLGGSSLGGCDKDKLRLTDLQWRYMYGGGSSGQACELIAGVARRLATSDMATKRGDLKAAQHFINEAAASARRELTGHDLEGALSYVVDAQDRLNVRIQADKEKDVAFANIQAGAREENLVAAEEKRQEQKEKDEAAWTPEDQEKDNQATEWAKRGDWWGKMKYAFSSLPGGHKAMSTLPKEAPKVPDPAKKVMLVAGLALAGYVGFQVFVTGKTIKKALF